MKTAILIGIGVFVFYVLVAEWRLYLESKEYVERIKRDYQKRMIDSQDDI